MSNLSSRLDDITRLYWQLWHDWRYSQGWRLGPDNPAAKLSPFLVSNWDQLGEEGRTWFRQHSALLLAAIDQLDQQPVKPRTRREMLEFALKYTQNGRVREVLAVIEQEEVLAPGSYTEVVDALRKVMAAKLPEAWAYEVIKAALAATAE